MKIVIDISPLQSGHQFRGVGAYTQNLIRALKRADQKNEYLLVDNFKKAKDADILHYPYFEPFFLTIPLLGRKRIVVTIHDLIPLVFPKNYPPGIKGTLRFQIQKLSLKKVKAIITDSQASKKDILKFLKVPRDRVYVVYLAASESFKPITDHESLTGVKKKYHLPDKFVLYVGDVNFNKNILGLAAACKNIKLPLVIVGRQAAHEKFDHFHIENQPLVQLIKQYGNDPEVLRLGFVPENDLILLYNLASVYCQPSFYEGFGLPVLVAMGCGCPVVAANTSSLPEICGKAAILVNPHNVDDLARGIKLVLNNAKLKKRLIQEGFRQAKKFSWEKTARETIKVYEKVFDQ